MKKSLALLIVGGLTLSACGSGGGNAGNGINSLGSFFVRAFNQSPNDEPLSLEGQSLPQFPTLEPFPV